MLNANLSTLVLLVLLLVVLVVLGWAIWKLRNEVTTIRLQSLSPQELITDVAIIKTHLQNLPTALGDIGAVKSQVEGINTAVRQLDAIKSQVDTLSGTTETIGGIKSQVETISNSVQQLEGIKSQVDTLSGTPETIGGIKSHVETLGTAVEDIGAIKSQMQAIAQTVQQIGTIKTELENVRAAERQLDETVKRIANKLVGSRDVGEAGENLLAEAFASFPPGWIERDFKVGGKPVEFALVLPNQKRVPIDSKFPAVELLERLGDEKDVDRRQEIINLIEAAVGTKALEAAKYIDPTRTIPLAIAAVPDAAYSVCRKVHFQAIGSDVLVISYSIALPVVLALYKFQLQYATSIDQENLEGHLKSIDSCLKVIENDLENRVKEAGTRATNAYTSCMGEIGKIRGSLSALRKPTLPLPESEATSLPAE